MFHGRCVGAAAQCTVLVCRGPRWIVHNDGRPSLSQVCEKRGRRMGEVADARGEVASGARVADELFPAGGGIETGHRSIDQRT